MPRPFPVPLPPMRCPRPCACALIGCRLMRTRSRGPWFALRLSVSRSRYSYDVLCPPLMPRPFPVPLPPMRCPQALRVRAHRLPPDAGLFQKAFVALVRFYRLFRLHFPIRPLCVPFALLCRLPVFRPLSSAVCFRSRMAIIPEPHHSARLIFARSLPVSPAGCRPDLEVSLYIQPDASAHLAALRAARSVYTCASTPWALTFPVPFAGLRPLAAAGLPVTRARPLFYSNPAS